MTIYGNEDKISAALGKYYGFIYYIRFFRNIGNGTFFIIVFYIDCSIILSCFIVLELLNGYLIVKR